MLQTHICGKGASAIQKIGLDTLALLHHLLLLLVMASECLSANKDGQLSLGLLLGTQAPIMTPDGIDFSFLSGQLSLGLLLGTEAPIMTPIGIDFFSFFLGSSLSLLPELPSRHQSSHRLSCYPAMKRLSL